MKIATIAAVAAFALGMPTTVASAQPTRPPAAVPAPAGPAAGTAVAAPAVIGTNAILTALGGVTTIIAGAVAVKGSGNDARRPASP